MKIKISYYWLCQVAGWGLFIIINTFFYYTLSIRNNYYPHFFETIFFQAALGLLVTHLMRLVILEAKLLALSLQKQIMWLILITFSFVLVYSSLAVVVEEAMNWEPMYYRPYSFIEKWLRNTIGTMLYLTIWSLLYFVYHYVVNNQRQKLNEVRLETVIKELELKTIKAHINPHFIFNALNSIRALVEENPERARNAITQLSQLLRGSMNADKDELVPLEKELTMVKNYLALEKIRFEERLQISFEIDEDTMQQLVPPMMLQTLVENAIKHGISKEMKGGHIYIISDFKDDQHDLIVRNTGRINGDIHGDGFGLSSTRNRLQLLYGEKASFTITNLSSYEVAAHVILPVTI